MADGTPDFADLLAAFDDPPPAVSLQQITGTTHGSSFHPGALPVGGSVPLQLSQGYAGNQNYGQFAQGVSQRGFQAHNQMRQFSAASQDLTPGLRGNSTFVPADDVSAHGAADDSFSGGSLGSMFLSSVESLLSDEGGNSFMMQVPQNQTSSQQKSVQRKPRQRQKPNTTSSRTTNFQTNKVAQNVDPVPAIHGSPYNIPQSVASPLQRPVQSQNTALIHGMKMGTSVTSPPFVMPTGMPENSSNTAMSSNGGQQKGFQHNQGQFVHPTLGRQQLQSSLPTNPPRPLSAASSTSDHPGSVPQPSPSCGSNHSGDPATPLTPQSYNAGTPQSYNPGTPQSNILNQQRQRASGYSDLPQQVPGQSSQLQSVSNDNFTSHQQRTSLYQQQPSPMRSSINTSNDSLPDLPTPLKESFISPIATGSFHNNMNTGTNNSRLENSMAMTANASNNNISQPWMPDISNNPNSGPAVMAPNALFINNTQPSINQSGFMPSDMQLNFGIPDMGSFSQPIQNQPVLDRADSNIGTASLTSKQNQLLDQLSTTFGKSKGKQPVVTQPSTLDNIFDSGSSGAISNAFPHKSDITHGLSTSSSNTTINMMNKANDAGAAAVKELFSPQTAQYEAISPVSDYAMSPANKMHDDALSGSILFSPPKFPPDKPDMTMGHNIGIPDDAMTDPVLMYLKHDDDKVANTKTSIGSKSNTSNSFLPQNVTENIPSSANREWMPYASTSNSASVAAKNSLRMVGSSQSSLISSLSNSLTSFPNSSNPNSTLKRQNPPWESSLPLSVESTHYSADALPFSEPGTSAKTVTSIVTGQLPVSEGAKNLPSSPLKKNNNNVIPNKKAPDKQGSFGVNRRKSSTEKSKPAGKTKKMSSYDEDFGFESDDDAEPTIRLSKPAAKTKLAKTNNKHPNKLDANLISPKARAANALVGTDLKNQMEHLKKLHEQQEMLLKIQQFQAQHSGAAPVSIARSLQLNMNTQAAATKSQSVSLFNKQPPLPAKDKQAVNQPMVPALPQPKLPTISQSVTSSKRPSLDFSFPLTAAPKQQFNITKEITNKGRQIPGVSHISSSSSAASTTLSYDLPTFTTTVSQALPHFLNFLTSPATCAGPVLGHTPYSVNPSSKHQHTNKVSTSLPVSDVSMSKHSSLIQTSNKAENHSVSTSTSVSSHSLPYTPLTSSSALTSIANSSGLHQQSIPLFYPPVRSMPDDKTVMGSEIPSNLPLSFSASLPHKNLPSSTPATFAIDSKTKTHETISDLLQRPKQILPQSRPQPFDNRHFDFNWLHREPNNSVPDDYKTPESGKPVITTISKESPLQKTSSSTQPIIITSLVTAPTMTISKSVTNLPQEEGTVTLKQSIHTVHHIDIPKTISTGHAAPSSVSKDISTPVVHETKHLNLKKHRILEGYPHSTDNFKPIHSTPSTKHQNGISTTVAHSVLDKQRRYSKEHSSKKVTHRVFHHVTDNKSSITTQSKHPSTNLTEAAASDKGLPTGQRRISLEADKSTASIEKPDKKEDDQAGSMLSLFNSLLQEASESAADSLKNKAESSEGISPVKQQKPVFSTAQRSRNADKSLPVVASINKTSTMPVAVTTCFTTVVQPVPSVKKIPKKNRPAATVPFKRRPYPAIDDHEAINLTTSSNTLPITTSVSKPKPSLVKTVAPINPVIPSAFSVTSLTTTSIRSKPPTTSTTPINLVIPSALSVASSTTTSIVTKPPTISTIPSVTATVVAQAISSTKPSNSSITTTTTTSVSVPVLRTETSSPKEPSAVPKLRITMFRSSKGQVIHQASMVGSPANEDSMDSDHTSRKKHKKKKKRKKRKRLSSSDYDSSVSSLTSMSSVEPSIKLNQIANKFEEIASKLIEKTIEQPPPPSHSAPIIKIAPIVDSPKPPQKRKRTKANTVEVADKKKSAKLVKVAKTAVKKKSDTKSEEPIARYQPKSVLNATSSSPGMSSTTKVPVTLPSTYQRAPGKLPLYLNTSDSKSATVPTIQLVARNTKLLETVVDTKSVQSKIVNSKPSATRTTKSLPTQLLTNAGVQYIIPNSRGQQRILLPNVSGLISVPMSFATPVVGRPITSSLFPISLSTLPSSKSIPIVTDITVSSSKSIVKKVETKVRNSKSPLKFSSASATKPLEAVSSLSEQAVQSGTVTRTLVLPRVTTKVTPSILPISMSMNSFQSTFSKLISSQNPVPQYVPPSPPDHLEIDPNENKHFQCMECKDTFMFNDSLEDHYDRRCILIKVRCMQCNQNLVFLNKCKLLLHARQHSDKGNGMQFNNAHISPLPLSMCKPRTKEAFLNKSASAERRRSSIASIASSEDDASSLNLNMSSASSDTVMGCTECNFMTTSPEALEEHFQRQTSPPSPDAVGGPKPTSTNFTCDMCSLTVPNQCSFNAHMRMHKRSSPHTCPECGKTFDNEGLKEQAYSDSRKEIDFNLHLSIECFHLSRMSCYKCRICSSIFKNAELLRRHLEVRHLQTFYKCRDCPMAFKTQENIASHQRSAHGVVAVTKTIHKCPFCDTVFTDNSPTQQLFLLQKHFEGHINHPSINITAYKCLFCNNIYERKSLLREHLKSAHGVTATNDTCTDDLTKEITEAQMLLDITEKESGGTIKKGTAKKRPAKISSKEMSISKVPKILSPDRNTSGTTSNLLIASGILGNVDGSGKKNSASGKLSTTSPAMMKSARQPVKLRLKGMTSHSNSDISSATSSNSISASSLKSITDDLTNMPATIIRDGKKVYPCGQCNKELPSASARMNHVKLKHKGIRTLYCCPYCAVDEIKFAKRISLKKHLKKVHGIEEMKKQDVRTEYVKIPVGQRFDPSTFNSNREDSQNPTATLTHLTEIPSERKQVRKKITSIGRKTSDEKVDRRVVRQARRNVENGSPYLENSDEEVEKITKNYVEDTYKSESESPDFSLLRFPNVYVCAKCGYQSKDRLEFQSHIVEHREEAELDPTMFSTMQQCTECGLCFASVASHAKHLFIKHKIKRINLLKLYDQRLRAEGSSDAKTEESSSAGKKHRCTVCFKRFDDDSKLRTHMRTHGLAFVKSKHVS